MRDGNKNRAPLIRNENLRVSRDNQRVDEPAKISPCSRQRICSPRVASARQGFTLWQPEEEGTIEIVLKRPPRGDRSASRFEVVTSGVPRGCHLTRPFSKVVFPPGLQPPREEGIQWDKQVFLCRKCFCVFCAFLRGAHGIDKLMEKRARSFLRKSMRINFSFHFVRGILV